jgi:hypothetical protein
LNIPGGLAKPALPTASTYVLRGCSTSVVVERSAFADFLDTVNLPVVYEDRFYWSTELSERLREGPSERSVGTAT